MNVTQEPDTTTIRQTVTFTASPQEVYELIMDSRKHESLSGEKAMRRGPRTSAMRWRNCDGSDPSRCSEGVKISAARISIYGLPMMCRWAERVPAHMIYAPVL